MAQAVSFIVGSIIALIALVSVLIPTTIDVVDDVNTTAYPLLGTILDNLPLFAGLAGLALFGGIATAFSRG